MAKHIGRSNKGLKAEWKILLVPRPADFDGRRISAIHQQASLSRIIPQTVDWEQEFFA